LMHVFNTSSSNVYFEGTKIYSYGSHYLMGQLHGNVMLINSRGYSVTTAKHTRWLRNATSNRVQIFVPHCGYPLDPLNKSYLINQFLEAFDKFMTGRSYVNQRYSAIMASISEFNLYCETFGIKDRIDLGAELTAELNALREEKNRAEKLNDAKRLERTKKEYAELEAKSEVDRIAWLNGTGNVYPRSWNTPVKLRIKNDSVETSQGAEVPLDAARKLFAAIEAGKNVKGLKIGMYTVDGVNKKCINIGCHCIPRGEARRVLGAV